MIEHDLYFQQLPDLAKIEPHPDLEASTFQSLQDYLLYKNLIPTQESLPATVNDKILTKYENRGYQPISYRLLSQNNGTSKYVLLESSFGPGKIYQLWKYTRTLDYLTEHSDILIENHQGKLFSFGSLMSDVNQASFAYAEKEGFLRKKYEGLGYSFKKNLITIVPPGLKKSGDLKKTSENVSVDEVQEVYAFSVILEEVGHFLQYQQVRALGYDPEVFYTRVEEDKKYLYLFEIQAKLYSLRMWQKLSEQGFDLAPGSTFEDVLNELMASVLSYLSDEDLAILSDQNSELKSKFRLRQLQALKNRAAKIYGDQSQKNTKSNSNNNLSRGVFGEEH